MLGFLLIYFVGKHFYNLADEYDRDHQRWGWAVLGVVIYYAGTFVAGFFLALTGLLQVSDSTADQLTVNLVTIPFGLLSAWGLSTLLKRNWARPSDPVSSLIDEIGQAPQS